MEQIDTLLNGNKIIQDPERFMFGIDAVLLSNFATSEVKNGDSLVDLGTGTGIIPLLMESVCPVSKIAALEIQHDSARMAKESVKINNLDSKIEIIEGDIKNVEKLFDRHSFEVVTTNPPYMINEHGRENGNDAKTIARHEVLCNLEDIISAAEYLLKPHGKLFMIHRPFRLPEIFACMSRHSLEPKRMRLVSPSAGKEPNIVLIEARKNANPRLKIEPELIVYGKPKEYSDEVKEIYNSFKKAN